MKKAFITFLFLVFVLSAMSQIIVTGKLLDSISNKSISYASIAITGTNKSTITNDEGSFTIKTDSLPLIIDVFFIGYVSKRVSISGVGEAIIKLTPITYHLAEVTVKANEADVIFKKAYQKLKNQKEAIYKAKSFFRLVTKNDNTYTEMIENFYDTWLGKSGIKYWELAHGRYAKVKNQAEMHYPVSLDFSELTRYLDILNQYEADIRYPLFPFDKNAKRVFVFTIGKRYTNNDQEIVRIDFSVKPHALCTKCYNGSIYVNVNTYNIYRLVLECTNVVNPPVFINDKENGMRHFNMAFDITLKPTINQQMLINHINIKMDYEILKKQSQELLHQVNTYSDLVFYDYESNSVNRNKIPFDEEGYDTDYNKIKHRLYLKRFWDNNPVLAETPLEKGIREDFEKTGSFGKTFNNSNDTIDLIKDGYLIWDKKNGLSFDDIPNTKDKGIRLDKLELNLMNPEDPTDTTRYKVGGLYSELFFAWNCYNDTFYYYVFPLLDIKATWAADTIRTPERVSVYGTERVYEFYFHLLEAHKRQFKFRLAQVSDICLHKKEVDKLYDQAQLDFYTESIAMLSEVWTSTKKQYFWYHKIEDLLEKYKDFE